MAFNRAILNKDMVLKANEEMVKNMEEKEKKEIEKINLFNEIVNYINTNIEDIKIASAFDLTKVEEKDRKLVYRIAGSCILNGPIGVNKEATWVNDEGEHITTTIKTLTGCTSYIWRNFCWQVAENFKGIDCHCVDIWGEVWPQCEVKGSLPAPIGRLGRSILI